ncbi:MAG TPA: MFS transporter [Caulobacteraceae bacterium]|nr:MFS transporter [Caulobacteraceae bacterium]
MAGRSGHEAGAWSIIRVAGGNFLEMYDFMVFGYYAEAIGASFFPSRNPFTSLMATFMTFGAAFLMRPLGAIVLGAYADRHGRRAGLLLTLALMSVGMVSLTIMPTYAQIGLAAPLLVLAGRLLQGFSAGMELGGVSVYLSEIAPPGAKGFYVSWQSASQQVAVVTAAGIGILLSQVLSRAALNAWGWRIPLAVGCLIAPVLFVLRRSLVETEAFTNRKTQPGWGEILRSLASQWRRVTVGMMLATLTTVSFYMITVYTPAFGTLTLHLPVLPVFVVTLAVGVSNLIWLPVMGALSDRVGRKPLLIGFSLLMLVSAYPAMLWLVSAPSFGRLLAVELWFSFIFGSYNGAMVVFLTEIIPGSLRASGFSLAYSLATAVFGGFTPAISAALVHATGNRAVPGLWLTAAATIGLVASLVARPAGKEAPG